ncbi:MAG: DUF3793 family protein [Lachnospiraceae bacterium]|nr:DUF3793 family protein [Lachnospiraceae bacterium]
MSEEMIAQHCSPTLAGLKTGNMFGCHFANAKEMRKSIRNWNRILGKKGLCVVSLKFRNNRALIYIYRSSHLWRDLQHAIACRLLQERGYGMETPEHCVMQLKKRLEQCEEFPHEIGLFLGYPPEDVYGFIKNKAGGCKCVGTWKVYGDEIAAQKLFAKYKKCTDVFCAQLAQGKSIERLTVAG